MALLTQLVEHKLRHGITAQPKPSQINVRTRDPAGPGIVPGSGSDPSVTFEAGIRIPAVFGAVGIKLMVSRRIRAELRSARPNMQHPSYYT